MTVFVSYSTRDKDAVKSLTQDLQDADEQVWLDQRLAGGDAWWRAILEQIRGCDVFIFALSQNSIQSKPCQAELHYAQALGLPILPVQVGPVDSMQLNPLATVQTVDYRNPTPGTAMRLIAALHRTRAQRQPLPAPLPEEPPVPFEYLTRLYTTIANPDYLTPRDQATLVAQLQVGLREDAAHDAARNDIVMLLGKLREREDVTYRTRTDVDAILASIDAESLTQQAIATDTTVPAGAQPGATTSAEEMLATAGAGEADAPPVLPTSTPAAHTGTAGPLRFNQPPRHDAVGKVARDSQSPITGYTAPSADATTVVAGSPSRRVGATLIDVMPILFIYGSAIGIAVLAANPGRIGIGTCHALAGPTFSTVCYGRMNATGQAAIVIGSLMALAYAIWNWGYRQGTMGSSIGESALKIKVLSAEAGRPVGFEAKRIAKVVGLTLVVLLPLSVYVYTLAHWAAQRALGPNYY